MDPLNPQMNAGAASLSSRAVIGQLLATLNGQGTWWAPIMERVESNQLNGEDYGFIGGPGQMTEENGDGVAAEPKVFPWFIRNRFWELMMKIPNREFRHAAPSKLRQLIASHAVSAGNHPGQLLQSLINAAETDTCYDGTAFFNASHPIEVDGAATTQSNIESVTVVSTAAITEAEMETALLKALAKFWNQRDNKGNEINLGLQQFTAMCPVAILPFLMKACQKLFANGGGSNIIVQDGKVLDLSGDGYKFKIRPQLGTRMTGNLLDLYAENTQDGGAYIQQVLQDQEEHFLDLDSEYSKVNKHVLATVSRAYNIGYGRYQRAVRVKFAQ